MMRLASIRSRSAGQHRPADARDEVAQDLQADVARLLRMELHAEDALVLDDGGEGRAVLGARDAAAVSGAAYECVK